MDETQFATLVGLLAEIRDRLTYLCQPAEAEETASACDHPEESRLDLSQPGRIDWTCGVCDHHEQRRLTHAPASPPSASAEE
jgi:C4-type Zn-finger protein